MNSYRLQIVTPDGCAFDGNAEGLNMRTSEGYVSILAGHADYIAALDIGEVTLTAGGTERRAACGGGFVSVTGGEVRMVTTTFEYSDDIDVDRASAAKEKAQKKIDAAKDARELEMAKAKLMRALTRLQVAGK